MNNYRMPVRLGRKSIITDNHKRAFLGVAQLYVDLGDVRFLGWETSPTLERRDDPDVCALFESTSTTVNYNQTLATLEGIAYAVTQLVSP